MRLFEAILGVGVITALTGCGYQFVKTAPHVSRYGEKGLGGTGDSPITVVGGSLTIHAKLLSDWNCDSANTCTADADPELFIETEDTSPFDLGSSKLGADWMVTLKLVSYRTSAGVNSSGNVTIQPMAGGAVQIKSSVKFIAAAASGISHRGYLRRFFDETCTPTDGGCDFHIQSVTIANVFYRNRKQTLVLGCDGGECRIFIGARTH